MRNKTLNLGSLLFVGAAATAITIAPVAAAQPAPPPPPPCVNPDGSPCGVAGDIPGGPGGVAGPGGASGYVPGGIYGSAGPEGASGCVPGVGCASIPAP